MNDWVDLRADGKMHGRLHVRSMVLEIRHGDRIFHYNLTATAEERRSVVDRVRISDAGIPNADKKRHGPIFRD